MIQLLIPALIILPLTFAFYYLSLNNENHKRSFSISGCISLMCLLGLGAYLTNTHEHSMDEMASLGFAFNHDVESFALAFFYTMVLMLSQYFLPKFSDESRLTSLMFLNISVTYGLLFSDNLLVMVTFYILSLLPTYLYIKSSTLKSTSRSRSFLIYNTLSIISLVSGITLLTKEGVLTTNLNELTVIVEHTQYTMAGCMLLIFSVMIREGIFPFHSWLRTFIAKSNLNFTMSFVLANAGFMFLYKVIVPLFNDQLHGLFILMAFASIGTSLYFSGLGLVETQLNSIFASIFLSESAMVLTGFELGDKLGLYGSLFEWMAMICSIGGFGIIIYLLKKRAGIKDIKYNLGLYSKTPKLAVLFMVFGLFTVGLPVGMGFIGEDLLIHGIIEHYPFLGIGIILAVSLNGINIYRIYNKLFLGESPANLHCDDLRNREAGYFVTLMFLMIILGLMPFTMLTKDTFNSQFIKTHAAQNHH